MRLLSTKILTPQQQLRCKQAGYDLTIYDSLTIKRTEFEIPQGEENLIFTSQNAAKSYLDNGGYSREGAAFCVGEKSAMLLEQNGHKIEEIGQNSAELGQKILINHKNSSFLYFSGNLRRPELPELLTSNNIAFKEITAYHTEIRPFEGGNSYDAALFFSPSGVESFYKNNPESQLISYCIGNTTAKAASHYTSQIKIAIHPTVDGVIDMAIKSIKSL